jgi:Uma2 family endonuclease
MAATVPATSTPLITYEQYMDSYLTEDVERRRYDIIDGVKEYVTSPTWNHQELIGSIYELLRPYAKTGNRGYVMMAPLDVLIRRDPLRTRQPDLFIISREKLERSGGIPKTGPVTAAPELVIEILSTSEYARRFNAKLNDYVSIGARECWVVRPEPQTVEVLRLTPSGADSAAVYDRNDTARSEVFPDLTVSVSDIFNL